MKKSASGAGTAAICNHFRLEEGTVIWGKGKVCRQSGCVSLFHFFGSSRKVGETNKGLGKAPKCRTRKKHESATNPIVKRGQGAIAPCRVKGQRPLWGLGQRPNCSASDHSQGSRQQRCRQRSVPASNFARPQTRPQAALPQRFREEQQKTVQPETAPSSEGKVGEITPSRPSWRASSLRGTPRRSR